MQSWPRSWVNLQSQEISLPVSATKGTTFWPWWTVCDMVTVTEMARDWEQLRCQQSALLKTSLLSIPANALQQNRMQPEKLLAQVLLQSRCEQFCCQTISCIFAFKNKECVVRQALSCNSMFAVNTKVFRFNVQLAYCILVYWPCDNSKTSVYTVQYLAAFILFYVIFFKLF